MACDPDAPYSAVKLCIHKIILPKEKLSPTPSESDDLDSEMEYDLRILGCDFIQLSGILLKLPQVAMASAQILYQRFYFSKSFVKHYYEAERRILKELGFCVHGKHPHKLVICYLQALEQHTNEKLVQRSWNYMNDVLRTDVFVRYHPEAISCACIYLAARDLRVPLPTDPSWVEMLCVSEESVRDIAIILLKIYKRPPPNMIKIEARLVELRKAQTDARIYDDRERELEAKRQLTQEQAQMKVQAMMPNSIAANESSQENSSTTSPTKHGLTSMIPFGSCEGEFNGIKSDCDKKIEVHSSSSITKHLTSSNTNSSQAKSKTIPSAFAVNKNDAKALSNASGKTTTISESSSSSRNRHQKHQHQKSQNGHRRSSKASFRRGSTSSMSIDSGSDNNNNNNNNKNNTKSAQNHGHSSNEEEHSDGGHSSSSSTSSSSSSSLSPANNPRVNQRNSIKSHRSSHKYSSSSRKDHEMKRHHSSRTTKGSHADNSSPSRKKKTYESSSKRYPISPQRSRKRKSSSPSRAFTSTSSSHHQINNNIITISINDSDNDSRYTGRSSLKEHPPTTNTASKRR